MALPRAPRRARASPIRRNLTPGLGSGRGASRSHRLRLLFFLFLFVLAFGGGLVDEALRDPSEFLVRFLFLVERLFEDRSRVTLPKQVGPDANGAVARDFVVLT